MDIEKLTEDNINILKNLKKTDNLICNRGEFKINDEFIQVDNITEIEYGIYFSFHQICCLYAMEKSNFFLLNKLYDILI